MKKICTKCALQLIPDLLILVNNPKQPFHARNSFTNRIFWKRIIKKFLKSFNFIFLSNYMSSVCSSYALVCHSYVTHMYSYVIHMSLVCTRMLSVCHCYVLVCHPYVTRMYSYVIRMSLVCGFTMNPICRS